MTRKAHYQQLFHKARNVLIGKFALSLKKSLLVHEKKDLFMKA